MGQLLRAGAHDSSAKYFCQKLRQFPRTITNDLMPFPSDRGPVRLARASELPHLQDDTHLGEGAQETPSGQFGSVYLLSVTSNVVCTTLGLAEFIIPQGQIQGTTATNA